MANLLKFFGDRAKAVQAQVNPFDNGKTYNTVRQNVQPIADTPSFAQRYSPANVAGGVGDALRQTPQITGRTLQAFPRGVAQLSVTGAQALGAPIKITPNKAGAVLFGKQPLISLQDQFKADKTKHGILPAVGLAAFTAGSDLPVGPGKLGKVAKGEKLSPALPKTLPVKLPGTTVGQGVRQFPETVRKAPTTPPAYAKAIKEMPYTVRPNAKTLKKATSEVLANPQKALNEAISIGSSHNVSDLQQAKAFTILHHAIQRGDNDLADQILESTARSRTEIARALQIGAAYSRTTPAGVYKYAKQLGADGTEAKGFFDRAGGIAKIKNKEAQDLERFKLLQDVGRLQPSGWADKLVHIWKAGLLTAPVTHLGNIVGNTAETITKQGLVNPVANLLDIPTSLITGKRSRAFTGRGLVSGTGEGVTKGAKYLKTNYDPRRIMNKYDMNNQVVFGRGPLGKAANAYTQTVFRTLGTPDQPYYYANLRQSLASSAVAEAKNQGLKGPQRKTFIDKFIKEPPSKAFESATKDAERAIFGNQTKLAQGVEKFRGHAFGQFIVPFAQVPASIATRVLERSPAGFVKAGNQIVQAMRGKGFDQKQFTETMANASIGTTGAIVVGKTLVDHNMINLGFPQDQSERKRWELEGRQPYSIRLGNKWVSLNYVQPFGSLIAAGAAYEQARRNGKGPEQALENAGAEAGKAVTSQSFLKGLAGAAAAIQDPATAGAKFVEQTAGSIVPNAISAIARAKDPVQREVSGVVQSIQNDIPGKRQNLPAKQDSFGRPIPRQAGPVNVFLNPLRPSDVRTSPTITEIRRLSDAGQSIVPSTIRKDSLGQGTSLSKQQIRDLGQAYGSRVQDSWNQIISDPRYSLLTNEDKQSALEYASKQALHQAKVVYAREHNLPEPKGTVSDKDPIGRLTDVKGKTVKKAKAVKVAKASTGRKSSGGSKSSKVSTAKFKTASTKSIPKPKGISVKKLAAPSFKSGGVKKLSVSKIPSSYRNRKLG